MSRAVVIGAGLGGLAAAARLARLRHDVVVVEAADVVGGHIGTITRTSFAWDTGPTYVTLPAALRDLFLKTGKPLESVLELEPLEPLALVRFADGTAFEIPNTGVLDVAAAFDGALGDRSGAEWRRFHDHAGQVWAQARGVLIEGPMPGRRELLRNPRLWRALTSRRTLRDEVRRVLHDERQRMWVEHSALAAGLDPRRAPSWMSVWPYIEQTFRAWTVRGGMRQLVDAVHERAVSRGAVVHTTTRAVAITTAAGRVDGVRLEDGRVLPADIVVSDVDARHLYDVLLPRETLREEPVATTPSAAVFTLLLGVRGLTPDTRRRTVLLPGDAEAELEAVFGAAPGLAHDPTLSVHVSRDPAHAPEGSEAWTVQVTVPRHGEGPGAVDWSADVAARYSEHLLDRLAAGGVDVRDRVVVAEHRSPADVERSTGSPGGASYGTAVSGPRAAWRRPANRSPVPGLFLVGASAHPGSGIPSVTMSAAIVAEAIGRA